MLFNISYLEVICLSDEGFEESIRKHDRGKDWGGFTRGIAKQIFSESISLHIAPLVDHIVRSYSPGTSIRVADLGGGNGIVAKALLSELAAYPNLTVDVLDIDQSKFFSDTDRLRYVKHDARSPMPKRYDAIMCRYVLHYNTHPDSSRILRAIRGGLSSDGLANVVCDVPINPDEKGRADGLFRLLDFMVGSCRKYWSTQQELEAMIRKEGLRIVGVTRSAALPHDADSFYRERFGLNQEQCEAVNGFLGGNPIMMSATSFLLKR